ncbi:hypothetical protein ON010_g10747 [Phytophthora cinnamomi]|nr:hypothetical protein ON010_g10747 [Phytophthora cinnamomi]
MVSLGPLSRAARFCQALRELMLTQCWRRGTGGYDSATSFAVFGWDYVRQALLRTAGVEITLSLSKSTVGQVQEELLKAAIEIALWGQGQDWHFIQQVHAMDPTLLPGVIATLSKKFGHVDASSDECAVLSAIVVVRIDWLNSLLQALVKPFNREILKALFCNNATIQAFLRGPSVSMTTTGVFRFGGLAG